MNGVTTAIEINIDKKSFWNISCRELISVDIGKWLIKNKLAPWLKGNPPHLELNQIDGRQFTLSAQ